MTKKIFKSVFLVSLVVLLLSTVLIFGVLYEYTTNVSRSQLQEELKLAACGVETEGEAYLSHLPQTDLRITWIQQDGTVLYDSSDQDTSAMENHLEREEVQEALRTGYGESQRYSSTLLERLLYAAQKLQDGSILRLAITQNSIWSIMLGMLQPLAIVLLLAILLSVFLSVRMSRRIVEPLNDLDLDHPLENEGFDELSPLFRRLATQQNALTIQENHLEQQQEELDSILGNMQEGMILLRQDNSIVSMNDAVDRILHISGHHIGENLLEVVRDLDLAQMVEAARQGQQEEKILSFYGRDYQVSCTTVTDQQEKITGLSTSPRQVASGSGQQAHRPDSADDDKPVPVKGMTVVFFDVTEKERAEQIRREFTANVSHELKTPLHAISGYAELLKSNVVRQQDVQPFAEKIYKESQRTIRMVEDIISLSHLDEGAEEVTWEETDVDQLTREALERLRPEAEDKHVAIHYHGTPAVITAKPALVSEIIGNLCDNAIKYNKEGGSVDVTVRMIHAAHTRGIMTDTVTSALGNTGAGQGVAGTSAVAAAARRKFTGDVADFPAADMQELAATDESVELTVSDTGIGIPPKDQERIFERFYRVDKSHSRDIGGTGLGLSIVKHAVAIHHGTIHLTSTPGQGTTFTVILPGAASSHR